MSAHGHSVLIHDYSSIFSRFDVRLIGRELLFGNKFITPSVMVLNEFKFRFDPNSRHMEDYALWLEYFFEFGQIHKILLPLATIHKSPYGDGGLSGDMLKMELSELSIYRQLLKHNRIGWMLGIFLYLFSFFKFLRRLGIAKFR